LSPALFHVIGNVLPPAAFISVAVGHAPLNGPFFWDVNGLFFRRNRRTNNHWSVIGNGVGDALGNPPFFFITRHQGVCTETSNIKKYATEIQQIIIRGR